MNKKKNVSVREFLGRLWTKKKFTWALVWNDGDDTLYVRINDETFCAFEVSGEVLAENETIEVDTEFSSKDWVMGVRHWIPASVLPHYETNEPTFVRGDELLNIPEESEP